MIISINKNRTSLPNKILSGFIAFTFMFGLVLPPGYAQIAPQTILNLPTPGAMVPLSSGFMSPSIIGLTVHPENPLMFDFIVDTGDADLNQEELKTESEKLIKYFLASLTVPAQEMWVNLSPYEKDRIIPQGFGDTEMGRDLLAQDYLLKQLTASLMYPEDELGKAFWKRVYKKAHEQYGTAEIPMNTFNKVWIVPAEAVVYEHQEGVFVVDSRLKVMLEEDYVALHKNLGVEKYGLDNMTEDDAQVVSGISSEIVKEILIPEIEKEVNEGKTFANLRQVYNSMILAAWYKQNLKESLLGRVYVDQNKTKGVDTEDKQINQKIYEQYVAAFKKGVYNYIREDYDPASRQMIPRKYFSGGLSMDATNLNVGGQMKKADGSSSIVEHFSKKTAKKESEGKIYEITAVTIEAGPETTKADIKAGVEVIPGSSREEKTRSASSPMNEARRKIVSGFLSNLESKRNSWTAEVFAQMADPVLTAELNESINDDGVFGRVYDVLLKARDRLYRGSRIEFASLIPFISKKVSADLLIETVEALIDLDVVAAIVERKRVSGAPLKIDNQFYKWVIENESPESFASAFKLVESFLAAKNFLTDADIQTLKERILQDTSSSPVSREEVARLREDFLSKAGVFKEITQESFAADIRDVNDEITKIHGGDLEVTPEDLVFPGWINGLRDVIIPHTRDITAPETSKLVSPETVWRLHEFLDSAYQLLDAAMQFGGGMVTFSEGKRSYVVYYEKGAVIVRSRPEQSGKSEELQAGKILFEREVAEGESAGKIALAIAEDLEAKITSKNDSQRSIISIAESAAQKAASSPVTGGLEDAEFIVSKIADSRGRGTPQVELRIGDLRVTADVPAGASKGEDEAYVTKTPEEAIGNIQRVIVPMLKENNLDLNKHEDLIRADRLMIEKGGDNFKELGANATVPVSRALWLMAAQLKGMTLASYIKRYEPDAVFNNDGVYFYMNIFNGGLHALKEGETLGIDRIPIQEVMVALKAGTYHEALDMGDKIDAALKKILVAEFGRERVTRADEAGFSVKGLGDSDKAIAYVFQAVQEAGYKPGYDEKSGRDVRLALDVASTTFDPEHTGTYDFMGPKTSDEMVAYYEGLNEKYRGLLLSVEDGFGENDWNGWQKITASLKPKGVRTIGDDLFVTQLPRFRKGIAQGAADTILIKVNQNGTMTGTLDVMKEAKRNGYQAVVSHRSGETMDTTIADLAYGTNAFGLKTGDPQPDYDFGPGGEYAGQPLVRRAKYTQMVNLESASSPVKFPKDLFNERPRASALPYNNKDLEVEPDKYGFGNTLVTYHKDGLRYIFKIETGEFRIFDALGIDLYARGKKNIEDFKNEILGAPDSIISEDIKKKVREAASSPLTSDAGDPLVSLGASKQQTTKEKFGGINLNPELLDLQIRRDASGIPLPLPMQPIGEMTIDGFFPVIINMTPVVNLPLLLGIADSLPGDDEGGQQGGERAAFFDRRHLYVSEERS